MIIYKLTSPSGKSYIGLTKGSLETRWKQHVNSWRKLKKTDITDYRGLKVTPILFFGFDKYDPSLWVREILFTSEDYKELRNKEVELIEQYDTVNIGYNVLNGGQFGHYGRQLAEEHRHAMSISKKEYWQTQEGVERRKDLSDRMAGNKLGLGKPAHNKGKVGEFKHSETTKETISKRLSNKPKSEDHKRKISEAKKGQPVAQHVLDALHESRRGKGQTDFQKSRAREANSQTWLVTFPNGQTETITNLRQFCKDHGLSQGNLSTYGHTKGYKAEKI